MIRVNASRTARFGPVCGCICPYPPRARRPIRRAQARVAQAQSLGFNPGLADRKRNGNVYWLDIDLKPTDGLLNPSDLQGESGRIVRLEVKGCPWAGGQT